MEIWRVGYGDEKLPAVISRRTLAFALAIHLAFFAVFWIFAVCHGLFDKKEEIIPIDLTVVVNENLNGKEDEPPPLKKVEPPQPQPKPKPQPKKVKEPEKPKELEKIVTNIVTKVDKKEEKKPEKKVEKKEPEKPKKTAKELREERMKKMRESAKQVNKKITIEVKNAKESGDGRTAKKTLSDAEIQKLLNMGYRPGRSEQLATSDAQLAVSLIRTYVYAKWERPPWTDTLKPILVQVWFGNGGKILRYELKSSSGDAKADRTALSAISRTVAIPGLPPAFIDKYRSTGYPLRFTVTAE